MIDKSKLVEIFGRDKVWDDEGILDKYSCDQSFSPKLRPDCVVFAKSVEEVQQIVRLANDTSTPLVPYSSGLNLRGASLPSEGGIILNLTTMNKILEIDDYSRYAIVEPGVTYIQLQEDLMRHRLRVMIPFGVPPLRSVITSYMERDPVLASASFQYGNDLTLDMEVVLPEGEILRTGSWTAGARPGFSMGPGRELLFKIWTAAQGTLGIITKMVVLVHPIPKIRKVFFLPFDGIEDMIDPLKRIQRREVGLECFALNSFNLAALFADGWSIPTNFPSEIMESPGFNSLREKLPLWTLMTCLNSSPRFPEEKVAYEEEALREVCRASNVECLERLPEVSGSEKILLEELLNPWRILKKFRYRGSVHDLSFKLPLKKIAEVERIISNLSSNHGYSTGDIGGYILPIERGRAIHCEFDLHCDLGNSAEKERVKNLWLEMSEALMNAGAYFDRPYGPWADMVYRRGGTYTAKVKELKKEMDPNNILNPGKLCF